VAATGKAPSTGWKRPRTNDQWRIRFDWPERDTGPSEVEIVDYHH
jgi:plasmid maintenance system killer protein